MRARTVDDQIRTEQLIHDFRSPLSAIRGYAQLLQRRLGNDGAKAVGVEDGLRRILESVARVGQLIDELAESAAPETTSAVKREPTELVQLARRVAAESEAAAAGNGHVVVLTSRGGPGGVVGRGPPGTDARKPRWQRSEVQPQWPSHCRHRPARRGLGCAVCSRPGHRNSTRGAAARLRARVSWKQCRIERRWLGPRSSAEKWYPTTLPRPNSVQWTGLEGRP
jgi:hypothetical protein